MCVSATPDASEKQHDAATLENEHLRGRPFVELGISLHTGRSWHTCICASDDILSRDCLLGGQVCLESGQQYAI